MCAVSTPIATNLAPQSSQVFAPVAVGGKTPGAMLVSRAPVIVVAIAARTIALLICPGTPQCMGQVDRTREEAVEIEDSHDAFKCFQPPEPSIISRTAVSLFAVSNQRREQPKPPARTRGSAPRASRGAKRAARTACVASLIAPI